MSESAVETPQSAPAPSVSRWRRGVAWGIGLAVSLLLAGVVSFYASSSPDGLEWVAEQNGFIEAGADSAALAYSPFADYQVVGLSNERLSVGLAGIVGTVIVLGVGMGLMWLLGRSKTKTA